MTKSTLLALTLLLLFGSATVLGACNTMAGAGEDISRGGSAIKKSAEEHSP